MMLKGVKNKAKAMEMVNDETLRIAQEQQGEFLIYTSIKTRQNPDNEFFANMHSKLKSGVVLTDNMVAALRKCMERDKAYLAKTSRNDQYIEALRKLLNVEKLVVQEEEPAGQTVTIKIKPWIQKEKGLHSRILKGKILHETARAILFKGHADVLEGVSWCMRCGRELTQPASYTIGFGEDCARKMGVPYPAELNKMDSVEREQYAKSIRVTVRAQEFEGWIPKSQIAEFLL